MSRSRKKPWCWLSKPWDKFKESALRRKVKNACREFKVDPDKDWEDLYLTNRTDADWGTGLGFDRMPGDGDATWWHEEYEKLKRK